MKRFIVLFLSICTLIFSCNKDDSIAGTKWRGTGDASSMELTFTDSKFQLKEVSVDEFVIGSYVYEPPIITFNPTSMKDASGKYSFGGRIFAGSVNGKTLIISVNSNSLVFTKR